MEVRPRSGIHGVGVRVAAFGAGVVVWAGFAGDVLF